MSGTALCLEHVTLPRAPGRLARASGAETKVAGRYDACTHRAVPQNLHGALIVETLLNTLEAERYTCGPLLATIADELSRAGEGLEVAAVAAHSILARWHAGELGEAELKADIRALRPLVQARGRTPRGGGVSAA